MNTPAAGDALAAQTPMGEPSEPDTAAEDAGGVGVPGFDPSVPSPARMYDYYLGGKDNFAADREAAEQALSVVPFGREVARANRQFLGDDSFIRLPCPFRIELQRLRRKNVIHISTA
jgi:S-adenosyl methyltransferase